MRPMLRFGLVVLALPSALLVSGGALAKSKKDAAAGKSIEKVKWGEADGESPPLHLEQLERPHRQDHELRRDPRRSSRARQEREARRHVFGYDNLADYIKKTPYFGYTRGQDFATASRTPSSTLDGKTYKLAANNATNSLHGGTKGWDKGRLGPPSRRTRPKGRPLKLTYLSKDGEEGFPGHGTQRPSTYMSPTIKSLRWTCRRNDRQGDDHQHVPPHLLEPARLFARKSGRRHPRSTSCNHLQADKYTPGTAPDGTGKPVAGTPFDFTKPKPIGTDLKAAGSPGAGAPIGYDENWVGERRAQRAPPVAKLKDPKSGRVMTVESDQSGVQFYSGDFRDGSTKGKGRIHAQYSALCLEAQKFPNAINVPAWKRTSSFAGTNVQAHHQPQVQRRIAAPQDNESQGAADRNLHLAAGRRRYQMKSMPVCTKFRVWIWPTEGVLELVVPHAPGDRRIDAVHDRSGDTQAVLDHVVLRSSKSVC